MKLDGKKIRKLDIPVGIPPFNYDPNNPGALKKLAEANRTGLGRVIKYDDPPVKKRNAKTSRITKKRTAI